MNIGVAYDLRRDYLSQGYEPEQVAEFESDGTVAALEQTLRGLGHDVDMIGNGRTLCRRLAVGDRWDVVFNIAEGLAGRCREAQVPALLELYGIPYTFSDPLVCAATLDKSVAKRIVSGAGLPTPAFGVVRALSDSRRLSLSYPVFVKPLAEGTGKGIDSCSRVTCLADLCTVCAGLLRRFPEGLLVEKYLPGTEFTVAVLGNGRKARAIGSITIEIMNRNARGIYSYDMKETCETNVRYRPMPEGRLRREGEALAVEIYRLLECRDVARLDFRLDASGRPSFMEVNPLPGLNPEHSDLPMIAAQEGMSYTELIGAILDAACERTGVRTCRPAVMY